MQKSPPNYRTSAPMPAAPATAAAPRPTKSLPAAPVAPAVASLLPLGTVIVALDPPLIMFSPAKLVVLPDPTAPVVTVAMAPLIGVLEALYGMLAVSVSGRRDIS